MTLRQEQALPVTNWHYFHVLFTFIFFILMIFILFKSLFYKQTHTCYHQFHLLTLFQTIEKMKNTVY